MAEHLITVAFHVDELDDALSACRSKKDQIQRLITSQTSGTRDVSALIRWVNTLGAVIHKLESAQHASRYGLPFTGAGEKVGL